MSQIVTPGNLGQEFELGTSVPNKITVKVDGTSVARAADGTLNAPAPVWDNVAKTITFPAVNGAAAQVIDLSQFTTDIYVDGASFDAATNVLTFTDNDGTTADVTVDLSNLLGVSADAGNLLTAGTDGKGLLVAATVEALATETCTDAFNVNLFKSFTA